MLTNREYFAEKEVRHFIGAPFLFAGVNCLWLWFGTSGLSTDSFRVLQSLKQLHLKNK